MSLSTLTSAELLELRTRVTRAAIAFYTAASGYTRQQTELPELSTPELVAQWQALRDSWAVANAAGHEQFELLTDIATEYAHRAMIAGARLEGMSTEDAVRYIESGQADA